MFYYKITYIRPARKQIGYEKRYKTFTINVSEKDLPYWKKWLDLKGYRHIIH